MSAVPVWMICACSEILSAANYCLEHDFLLDEDNFKRCRHSCLHICTYR